MKKIIYTFLASCLLLGGCAKPAPSNENIQADDAASSSTYADRNNHIKETCIDYGESNFTTVDLSYVYIEEDEASENYGKYGWKYLKSDKILVPAQYQMVFSNCFDPIGEKGFAAFIEGKGIWYVNEHGEKLMQAYNSNGPDRFSENELVRFVEFDKVGFMNEDLERVIWARYDWASAFKDGEATICIGCKRVSDGEHSRWEGGAWGTVNLEGAIKWTEPAEAINQELTQDGITWKGIEIYTGNEPYATRYELWRFDGAGDKKLIKEFGMGPCSEVEWELNDEGGIELVHIGSPCVDFAEYTNIRYDSDGNELVRWYQSSDKAFYFTFKKGDEPEQKVSLLTEGACEGYIDNSVEGFSYDDYVHPEVLMKGIKITNSAGEEIEFELPDPATVSCIDYDDSIINPYFEIESYDTEKIEFKLPNDQRAVIYFTAPVSVDFL